MNDCRSCLFPQTSLIREEEGGPSLEELLMQNKADDGITLETVKQGLCESIRAQMQLPPDDVLNAALVEKRLQEWIRSILKAPKAPKAPKRKTKVTKTVEAAEAVEAAGAEPLEGAGEVGDVPDFPVVTQEMLDDARPRLGVATGAALNKTRDKTGVAPREKDRRSDARDVAMRNELPADGVDVAPIIKIDLDRFKRAAGVMAEMSARLPGPILNCYNCGVSAIHCRDADVADQLKSYWKDAADAPVFKYVIIIPSKERADVAHLNLASLLGASVASETLVAIVVEPGQDEAGYIETLGSFRQVLITLDRPSMGVAYVREVILYRIAPAFDWTPLFLSCDDDIRKVFFRRRSPPYSLHDPPGGLGILIKNVHGWFSGLNGSAVKNDLAMVGASRFSRFSSVLKNHLNFEFINGAYFIHGKAVRDRGLHYSASLDARFRGEDVLFAVDIRQANMYTIKWLDCLVQFVNFGRGGVAAARIEAGVAMPAEDEDEDEDDYEEPLLLAEEDEEDDEEDEDEELVDDGEDEDELYGEEEMQLSDDGEDEELVDDGDEQLSDEPSDGGDEESVEEEMQLSDDEEEQVELPGEHNEDESGEKEHIVVAAGKRRGRRADEHTPMRGGADQYDLKKQRRIRDAVATAAIPFVIDEPSAIPAPAIAIALPSYAELRSVHARMVARTAARAAAEAAATAAAESLTRRPSSSIEADGSAVARVGLLEVETAHPGATDDWIFAFLKGKIYRGFVEPLFERTQKVAGSTESSFVVLSDLCFDGRVDGIFDATRAAVALRGLCEKNPDLVVPQMRRSMWLFVALWAAMPKWDQLGTVAKIDATTFPEDMQGDPPSFGTWTPVGQWSSTGSDGLLLSEMVALRRALMPLAHVVFASVGELERRIRDFIARDRAGGFKKVLALEAHGFFDGDASWVVLDWFIKTDDKDSPIGTPVRARKPWDDRHHYAARSNTQYANHPLVKAAARTVAAPLVIPQPRKPRAKVTSPVGNALASLLGGYS